MTNTETAAQPYAVTYTRGTDRYEVSLDGVRVGWVLKADGGWNMFAPIHESLRGECVGWDRTRAAAVEDGIGSIRTRAHGSIVRCDLESGSDTFCQDVPVYFDRDRLAATEAAMSFARWGF